MQDLITAILAALKPYLIELIGIAVTILIAQITLIAKRKWGIDIEARHRDALHAALTTGAQLALDRKLSAKAAIDLAVAYARQSVPDAIKALKPDPDLLEHIARAKIAAAGK